MYIRTCKNHKCPKISSHTLSWLSKKGPITKYYVGTSKVDIKTPHCNCENHTYKKVFNLWLFLGKVLQGNCKIGLEMESGDLLKKIHQCVTQTHHYCVADAMLA